MFGSHSPQAERKPQNIAIYDIHKCEKCEFKACV